MPSLLFTSITLTDFLIHISQQLEFCIKTNVICAQVIFQIIKDHVVHRNDLSNFPCLKIVT